MAGPISWEKERTPLLPSTHLEAQYNLLCPLKEREVEERKPNSSRYIRILADSDTYVPYVFMAL